MIQLKSISKVYRMGEHVVHALKDINLTVDDGEFVAIMGPSGSGKSTLAHILGLLDVPTSGSFVLNGKEVSKLTEDELAVLRREEIGFIFQQFNLLSKMSALENVSLPLLYSQKNTQELTPAKHLENVGLGDRLHHRPNELSGGQQQRVAIARSLVNTPRMILADEPTGNLDSNSETEIMKILKSLHAQGITIIMVTHEEAVAAQASRLIRMRDGKVQSDSKTSKPPVSTQETTHPKNLSSSTISVFEHFRQGLKVLLANKVRTVLSMLGILIGVAAVVAMLALGKGAQQAMADQMSSLGSNLLVLRSGGSRVGGVAQEAGTISRMNLDDVDYIQQKIGRVKAVVPSVSGRAQVTYEGANWSTQVQGVTAEYASVRASAPAEGRFFTDQETRQRARVVLIGATIIRELFGEKNALGEFIKINKINFQVIGVLPEKGSTGWRDQDDVMIIPVTTAMYRLLGKDHVDSIDIQVRAGEDMDEVSEEILELIYTLKKTPLSQRQDAFQVRNMADIQAAMTENSKTMSLLLASIAAISLIVGGIGIMNIMLVSVTERTKEIGLRKAIGARRKDILMQFLVEAVVVSVIGGGIGIFLGWMTTVILSHFAGWVTSVTLGSVALAFIFSAGIGVIFGIYPARKASLLHPIDALRYE